ncbi:hypothetical protein ACSSS7_001052 [Eimeria intestinalis]
MADQSTTCSDTPIFADSLHTAAMPAEAPPGMAPYTYPSAEEDLEHSLSQEKRMHEFFAADAAALSADPAAAASAAAAAADVIAAAIRKDEAEEPDHPCGPLVTSNPLKCNFSIFRIKNTQAYYEAKSLEDRLPMLGAEIVDQLCKTIVMENTKHTGKPQLSDYA